MPVTKKWTCDGCGESCETELDATTSQFYSSKITCGAWGVDVILCADCHERLMNQIDPRKWPRVARYAVAERAA